MTHPSMEFQHVREISIAMAAILRGIVQRHFLPKIPETTSPSLTFWLVSSRVVPTFDAWSSSSRRFPESWGDPLGIILILDWDFP